MEELKFIDKENYNMYIKLNSDGYRYIGDYCEGMFSTMHINGICGYINDLGYETFLFNYVFVDDYHNGRALVKNNEGFYGYIDYHFNEVIPCKYTYCSRFFNGYAIVKDNNNDKIIDKNDIVVKELEGNSNFENVLKTLYRNNLISKEIYFNEQNKNTNSDITIKTNELPFIGIKTYSYYTQDGKRIIECDSLEDRNFNGNFVVVKLDNNNFKIFNKAGKVLKIHSCIGFDIVNNKSLLDRAMQLFFYYRFRGAKIYNNC